MNTYLGTEDVLHEAGEKINSPSIIGELGRGEGAGGCMTEQPARGGGQTRSGNNMVLTRSCRLALATHYSVVCVVTNYGLSSGHWSIM